MLIAIEFQQPKTNPKLAAFEPFAKPKQIAAGSCGLPKAARQNISPDRQKERKKDRQTDRKKREKSKKF